MGSLENEETKIDTNKEMMKIFKSVVIYLAISVCGAAFIMIIARIGRPVLTIMKPAQDFGTVTVGAKVDSHYRLWNLGLKPLHIKDVIASCGCVSEATVERQMIPVGGSANVNITWNAPEYETQIYEEITLVTDDPRTPSRVVSFKANTLADFTFSTDGFNFGINDNNTQVAPLSVVVTSKTPLQNAKLQADSHNPFIKIDILTLSANQWKITATPDQKMPIGPIWGDLPLFISTKRNKTLPFVGTVVGKFRAEPIELYQNVTDRKMGKEQILIQAENNLPYEIGISKISTNIQKLVKINISGNNLDITWNASELKGTEIKGFILLNVTQNHQITEIIIPVIFVK